MKQHMIDLRHWMIAQIRQAYVDKANAPNSPALGARLAALMEVLHKMDELTGKKPTKLHRAIQPPNPNFRRGPRKALPSYPNPEKILKDNE